MYRKVDIVMELVKKTQTNEDIISSLYSPVVPLSLPEHPEYSYIAVTMQFLCAAT